MAACDRNKLLENLKFIGCAPDDAVLQKCAELCLLYRISEDDLVDQWSAFAISNRTGNTELSLANLAVMERKELSRSKIVEIKTAPPKSQPVPVTPKKPREHVKQSLTQDISASPASQVAPYAQRTEPGKTVLSYGSNRKYTTCSEPIHVRQLLDSKECLLPDSRYMYEPMMRKMGCISGVVAHVSNCIARKQNIELPECYVKNNVMSEILYGKIVCDSEGKLNNVSVMLEMPKGEFSLGESLSMNLTQVQHYSLFPGQTVVTEGGVVKGTLNVRKLYMDGDCDQPPENGLAEPIQIIVAAGPFTMKNNMTYEPLQDLLGYVIENSPHILILLGPFLDIDHESLDEMTEAFDSFFANLVESIMTPLAETNTKVVFVSSHKDVHHHPIYPTPPYHMRNKYTNLLCVPDPCQLFINESLIIGITTADILFHIGKQELCWPSSLGDRMGRLAQHIIQQQHFYPLYPPDASMSVDHELLEKFGIFEKAPHVLILPSTFKHFIKEINGCMVINPERLVKGYSGGTFSRLNLTTKDVFCEIIKV